MDQDTVPRDEESSPTMFDDVEIKNNGQDMRQVGNCVCGSS